MPALMIIMTILIIFLTFLTSYGTESIDARYQACSSPVSCGKFHSIRYPFSVNGITPSYCGRALELHCARNGADDYPLLHIDEHDGASYQVLGINNFTIGFKLYHNNCLVHSLDPDAALVQRGLTYSSSVEDFLLWYECKNSSVLDGADPVTCSGSSGNTTTYYRFANLFNGDSCKIMKARVLRKDINNYLQRNVTLLNLLKKGFEMDYPIEDFQHCLHCEHSGGVCGSSENLAFVCFCKDQPYTYACPLSDSSLKSGSSKVRLIIGLASSAVVIGMLIILGLIVRKEKPTRKLTIFRRRGTENQNAEAFLHIYGSLAPERYTYSSLKKITNSFEEKLGEGGYATVYKGKLSDGRYVAVKLFKQLKGNGEDFINEVASIGRTNHVNIVSLLGFCYEGNERALIYEFMPNGSLEKFTFDKGSNRALPRGVLFNIVDGIAKGLDYLHQGCNERILHFDIKPHNILLDEDFCPKISDFGLARLCPQQESTISMLEARGTIGYIAPEVFCRSFGNVSHKSDVYSYGVMVLDLVCGRTNACTNAYQSSELYFTEWIYNQLELDEEVVVDGNVDDEERCLQRKMILVSLWCIQLHPSSRPSMSQVVELLNRSLELIPMPPRPCLSSFPSLGTIHSFETLPSEPLVTPTSN